MYKKWDIVMSKWVPYTFLHYIDDITGMCSKLLYDDQKALMIKDIKVPTVWELDAYDKHITWLEEKEQSGNFKMYDKVMYKWEDCVFVWYMDSNLCVVEWLNEWLSEEESHIPILYYSCLNNIYKMVRSYDLELSDKQHQVLTTTDGCAYNTINDWTICEISSSEDEIYSSININIINKPKPLYQLL